MLFMKIPVLHRKYGDFQHIIGVCNDKKRERIRNTPKEKRIAARLSVLAMTGKRKYNRTPYVFVITKRSVILSAKHERIRNILKGKRIAVPFGSEFFVNVNYSK